ncbi:MAG TPA: transposase [Sphingobacteriaceae bacterium]
MLKEDGSYYHLYNRGHNKEKIFFEEENYIYFLNRFKKHVLPHIDVFAYCLMPNHFHFFIRINNASAFEKGIKNFFISYAKSINKKYDRVGSLFQGRYKSIEITSDSYYTRIITYIHQNPFVAGLVNSMDEYKYSSYPAYLSELPSTVKRTEVINWFGSVQDFINCHKILTAPEDISFL